MAERCFTEVLAIWKVTDLSRYSEALLASDPLLGDNDSDDEFH
jgi:hypothetical protein